MKHAIIYSFMIFIALFSGCTYNLSRQDFEDHAQFRSAINELAENRSIKVTARDSTFAAKNIRLTEDSLHGIIFRPKYSDFYWSEEVEKKFAIPVSGIKNISITKRTSSIAEGLGIGALTGAIWGGIFFDLGGESISGHHPDYTVGAVMTGIAGAILGSIAGGIVGDDYVFSYYGKLDRHELFNDNSMRRFGLKIGYNGGFNPSNAPAEGHEGGNTLIMSERKPGYSVTLFHNLPLGKNFSAVTELSYISAGSNEIYAIGVPLQDRRYYTNIYSSSFENIKLIEAASLIRLNLLKDGFTPYIFLGPKLDFLIPPGNSQKEKFFSDINRQYGGNDFSISGSYEKFFWGGIIGAGISTGKLDIYEILLEIRYKIDRSDRFRINSFAPESDFAYTGKTTWIIGHRTDEFSINIGVAVD